MEGGSEAFKTHLLNFVVGGGRDEKGLSGHAQNMGLSPDAGRVRPALPALGVSRQLLPPHQAGAGLA